MTTRAPAMLKGIATVGAWTMASRVAGLARDLLIAAVLGAGPVSDAFFVANRLPNLFRRLFGEGAFNSAFVPVFSGLLVNEGESVAREFTEQAAAALAFWLLLLTVLGEVFMRPLLHLIAAGFADEPGKFELTVVLARLAFPYLLLICLAALLSGVLNAMSRFTAAAAAPLLYNAFAIAAMYALVPFVPTAGHALAIGVSASGVAQLGLLYWGGASQRHAAASAAAADDAADAAAAAAHGARAGGGWGDTAEPGGGYGDRDVSAGKIGVVHVLRRPDQPAAARRAGDRGEHGAAAADGAAGECKAGGPGARLAQPRHRIRAAADAACRRRPLPDRESYPSGAVRARRLYPFGCDDERAVAGGLCRRPACLRPDKSARPRFLRPRRHVHTGQDRDGHTGAEPGAEPGLDAAVAPCGPAAGHHAGDERERGAARHAAAAARAPGAGPGDDVAAGAHGCRDGCDGGGAVAVAPVAGAACWRACFHRRSGHYGAGGCGGVRRGGAGPGPGRSRRDQGGGATQAEPDVQSPALTIVDIGRHVAAGAAPRVDFQQIAPACRSRPPAPLFLFGPASRAVHDELFSQFDVPEVGVYALQDATVAPSGIGIKDDVAFNSAAFIHPPHHFEEVARRLHCARHTQRRVRGTLAVIYGPGHETYGHWLVDFLPRLWVLDRCGHDLGKLKYVVPPELTTVARQLLADLGIRRSQLVPYRYWQEELLADRLLLPTGLRSHNRIGPHFAEATAFWTRRLPARRPGDGCTPTHLFVSRQRVIGARILSNRAQIEAIAGARGYTIVHPQDMSLGEQAALFAGARVIVGEYGSALHGSVFSAPGTLTIGLRGNARHPSFVQSGLAASLGQQAGYVLGHMSMGAAEGAVGQVFTVEPADFERALDIAATSDASIRA